MLSLIQEKLDRINDWWLGKNTGRPLLAVHLFPQTIASLNRFWPSENHPPDFAALVAGQRDQLAATACFGEAYPVFPHLWGSRGTPMTMAAYLGGRVKFGEDTVWVEPVVDDWEKFDLVFDERNHWVQMSRQLLEAQLHQCDGSALVGLPDLGDALTVFSLLRGNENLLLDLVERPEIIRRKIQEYGAAWIKAHQYFWNLYRAKLPGDSSCLIWAPGKTYMVQCDFSTMISPALFREFVVPELERLSGYLEYMVWHLDGPEEIKHLDLLLDLPYIRAIQIQPGSNRPPAVSPLWLPQIKKIQAAGRSVVVSANTPEEFEILRSNLHPWGLYIGCSFEFKGEDQARDFVRCVER